MNHARCLFPVIAAAMLVACGGAGDQEAPQGGGSAPSGSVAAGASNTCGQPDFEQAMLARVNEARASSRACGSRTFSRAPALAWNAQLQAAAAAHAQDMARNDYFSHDSPDGRTFSQRISDAGYDWVAAGENIAAGQADIAQVVDAWLDSPGHCANIMSDAFTEVAVACVREDSATHGQYWAMSLGRR